MGQDGAKILGENRRLLILQWLKESDKPLTGSDLSKRTNVSRQVIVQDISLLKARNEPIIATSQGYILFNAERKELRLERVIACQHSPDDTKNELYTIVDNGGTVKDVTVEHPLYGDLTASLFVSNRLEADQFLSKLSVTNASLLSELTSGVHLHTIEASSQSQLEAVCRALKDQGFLLNQD
ncbi:transcription repressor NadR [Guptibacillus hwajinpoensis]|uniref:Transcriptional regulator of NAD metabolism n=1 Tax=Guptibacillus hwajinpoensis TaxID=208199 RepID=A0ABU0JZ00_9BACL|nr:MULTISPECIES: transcription repressor NadR [Alkalihalobacillus]MDP4550440.1 transcription repressor NadR [Alkalihalobacillus macyae]MDQ0481451.1 transcriptional regulator of NAD metabolism [Alkalihalobacillus hemicentroti]